MRRFSPNARHRWIGASALLVIALAALLPAAGASPPSGLAESKHRAAIPATDNLVYLVMGDSVSWGVGDSTDAPDPSYGDQGYILRFLNPDYPIITTQSTVANVGMPGETSFSIFEENDLRMAVNKNYTGVTTSQAQMALDQIAYSQAIGRTIAMTTLQIGGNDILGLSTETGQQLLTDLPTTLANIRTNITTLINNLQAASPGTPLYLIGYYRIPSPPSPIIAASVDTVMPLHMKVLEQLCAQYGCYWVDTFDAFYGNETTLVHSDDVHPTAAGYVLITQLLGSSSIPAARTFTGSITLQGCVAPAQPMTFQFRPTDGTPAFSWSVTLNSDGSFEIPAVLADSYTVAVKGAKWLQEVQTVDATSNASPTVSLTLPAGDVNNDNVVDLSDFSELAAAFGASTGSAGWDPNADLNCDGVVDLIDFNLLAANFGLSGTP
jgi:lysophospholipase L1-like esterase